MDQSKLFITCSTVAEIEDAASWTNTSYDWPQTQFDELCSAVGQALVAWAALERWLFAIYMASLQSASPNSASSIWDIQTGFRMRLNMTHESLLKNHNLAINANKWEKLKDRCRKKSLRRNALAHGTMFYEHSNKSLSKRFFIATIKTTGPLEPRIHTSDALSFRDAFISISEELRLFHLSIKTA